MTLPLDVFWKISFSSKASGNSKKKLSVKIVLLKAFYSLVIPRKSFVIDSLSLNSKLESFLSKVDVDFIYKASYVMNSWTSAKLPKLSDT